MSGGFFRGTSADQDTRFSNKQAKLLKSQKFAPELENLVDMSKVKMDVMKPWIAKRVTELIGFEDEVLINFIYGLLEGKDVNGKQVQISLTGFMERNTGKFMKELWVLLLSAQQNASGVPQQFLDAKEEETRKKKAETDRIANEIQRKNEKERQEADKEKTMMDGHGPMSGDEHIESELNVKRDAKLSSVQRADEKERYNRDGPRRHNRDSRSPDSAYHSPSPRRNRSMSPSKSSNSRSDSGRRSRSISGAPPSRSHSISSERRIRSPPRRSVTPHRRRIIQHSPSPRRRSLHSKRRSASPSHRRSPSPARYRIRSPWRYRSRSPLRRRSRTPMRRRSRTPTRRSPVRYRSRSPLRHRSPSPVRRRSPPHMRGRSPSPLRGGSPSPFRRRSPSPLRRRLRSPVRRRSPPPHRRSPSPRHQPPSPARRRYQRSPSTPQLRSISPVRHRSTMQGQKGYSSPANRRSPSPVSSSPSPNHRNPPSSVRKAFQSQRSARSPTHSPEDRDRSHEKYTPARHASPNVTAELPAKNRYGSRAVERKPVVSLRSPQRDMMERSDSRRKERELSPSMQKAPFVSDASGYKNYGEEQRPTSPLASPYQRVALPERSSSFLTAAPKPHHDNSRMSADDKDNLSSREIGEQKYRSSSKVSPTPVPGKDSLESSEIYGLGDSEKLRRTELLKRMDNEEHHERQELSTTHKIANLGDKERKSYVGSRDGNKDKNSGRSEDNRGSYQAPELEVLPKLSRKFEKNDKNGSFDSPSKEIDEQIEVKEKRKHKKSNRRELESDDYSSYDSYEERKEAKRRRKEEKRMKKEERRRRREERRRKRDERRAEKLKMKSVDSGSSSDTGQDHSEDDSVRRRGSRPSNIQETESEQRKLEIELREKALESLRAKKSLGN